MAAYTEPGCRAVLSAVLIRAMQDVRDGGYEGSEAELFLRQGGGWITQQLWGFDLDGEETVQRVVSGQFNHQLRLKIKHTAEGEQAEYTYKYAQNRQDIFEQVYRPQENSDLLIASKWR